jgi:hypothetical protein
VTVTADFDLPIAIQASTSIVNGVPVLTITPTILPPRASNIQMSISFAVALLITLSFGSIGIYLLVKRGQIQGLIEGALAAISPPAAAPISLPGGVDLNVTATGMNQADAPMEMFGSIPLGFRAHDLVINLSSQALPNRLEVSCIIPDGSDARRRIDAVGGVLPNSRRWALSIDEAIAAVQAGLKLFVGTPPNEVEVEVVEPDSSLPFLRTKPDASGANNLLALPTCP